MPTQPEPNESNRTHNAPASPVPVGRAFLGGMLMGLANLVPGISGGTMLVACGIYGRFIDAVSDATRLKLTRDTILMLGIVVLGGLISIVGLASTISWALTHHRWVMYALFIGLTLGGLPILWNLARPGGRDVWSGLVIGCVLMGALVFVQESGLAGSGLEGPVWLAVGGAAAAGAMILPGVSGAFLLLLLGQYEPIINAIKGSAKAAKSGDAAAILDQLAVIVPVGIGVLIGVVGVANLLRWLMHRYERMTLGALMGLLLAAPAGLYPFRAGVEPQIGDVIKGRVVAEENLAEMRSSENSKDWAQRAYAPSAGQIAGAGALIVLGFGMTLGIARLGRERETPDAQSTPGASLD